MRTLAAALLACLLTAACAASHESESTADSAPSPSDAVAPLPSCTETIVLKHADAIEVTATLNRLIESAYRHSLATGCAYPLSLERWHEVSVRPQPDADPIEPTASREPVELVLRDDPELQARIAEARELAAWYRDHPWPPGPYEPWADTLRALDHHTIAVLHAHCIEGHLERMRAYIAELDVAARSD
jgi:hypothetical protein